MSKKVFCGNLPWGVGDSELAQAMTHFGPVSEARVVTDRETGRSRGFGFVTFETEAAAEQAMQVGSVQIEGRTVRIDAAERDRAARPASDRPASGRPASGRPASGRPAGSGGRGGRGESRDQEDDRGRDDGRDRSRGSRRGRQQRDW